MQSALIAKEQLNADTPLLFFDCTLADGTVRHWSSQAVTWNGMPYEGRVIRHNLFEAQLASDTQVGARQSYRLNWRTQIPNCRRSSSRRASRDLS